MAQSAEFRISGSCTNASFETESETKSRTDSTSSSIMDSEIVSSAPSIARSTSSTTSFSYSNDTVEEIWNNFVFKSLQPDEDCPKVLCHMRESFYRDEPLNAYTGYSEEKAKDMDLIITAFIKHGLSSIVLEKETHKVAGARIIAIHRRDEHDKLPLTLNSKEMKKIMPFLDQVDEKASIFDHYPELEEYAEIFMVSVHPDFRGQGLAGEMYNQAIRLLQAKGFKLMKSCFTSPFTKRIGEKMGFRELAQTKFNEYKDEHQEIVFPNAKDDEVAVIGVLEI